MSYEIKLAEFEGPLDLLLHLIAKNKIDIYNIPVAELTRQYMNYIEESKNFNIEIATEFLVTAAKLMQIKSRMILPNPKKFENDEEIDDPREELTKKLLEYQKFQKIGKILSSMFFEEEKFFKREPLKLPKKILMPQNLSAEKLFKIFLKATAINEEKFLPEVFVESEKFHVKDKMAEIISRLRNVEEINFSEIIETNSNDETIITFLALLELIKEKKITAEQIIPFAEITIRKQTKNDE